MKIANKLMNKDLFKGSGEIQRTVHKAKNENNKKIGNIYFFCSKKHKKRII